MTVKEIRELINQAFIMHVRPEKLAIINEQVEAIKDDPLFLEILIKQASNECFHYIVEKFNLPETVTQQRVALQRNILNNPLNYPLEMVKNALCDIMFHNNPKNSAITIKTLQERADLVPSFNNLYQNMGNLYSVVMDILNLDPATATPEQISNLVQTAIQMNNALVSSNSNVYTLTSSLLKYANEDFKSEMCNKVKESYNKMTIGLTPIIGQEPNEPIGYRLENQTENQRGLFFLVRTDLFAPYMIEENALDKHIENSGKYPRTSYSIFTESLNRGYSGKRRITFGYLPNPDCKLVSSTPHDGQTFCYDISKGHIAMKQSFVPMENFIDQTAPSTHNEVMFETPEKIIPAMILVFDDTDYEIMEKSIEVAHAMNLPLVFIDKTAYPEHDPQNPVDFVCENNLIYELTLPYELEPISPELLVE